jgi:RNA polymerase primary sigma factor
MAIAEVGEMSLMAIDQYMRQVRWIPRLTVDEEVQLLERVSRGRTERVKPCPDAQVLVDAKQARDRLVEEYQGLVVFLAKKRRFLFRSMELLDLIQEGNLGLMQAIEEYDPSCGYPLRTVASHRVRHAIWEALRGRDRMVRLPVHVHKAVSRMERLKSELLAALDREPSAGELARGMQVSEEELVELERSHRCQEVASIQALVTEVEGEDYLNFVSLFEAAVVAEQAHQEPFEVMIRQAMETAITRRQNVVLQLRYGFDEGGGSVRSKREVAGMLGVTDESVGQVERAAIKRLSMVLLPPSAELNGYASV